MIGARVSCESYVGPAIEEWGISSHVLEVECKGTRKTDPSDISPPLSRSRNIRSHYQPKRHLKSRAPMISSGFGSAFWKQHPKQRFPVLGLASPRRFPRIPHNGTESALLGPASKSEMSSDGSAWQWRVKIRNRPLFRFNDVGLRNRGLSASSPRMRAISRLWAPGGCIWDTSNC